MSMEILDMESLRHLPLASFDEPTGLEGRRGLTAIKALPPRVF
ncbi:MULTISPECIES: hypothetical protein [Pseudomonas chlororaphis group]|nr:MULTISPECIES: hypothetical protein [Pseudomonas chlororaphis group]